MKADYGYLVEIVYFFYNDLRWCDDMARELHEENTGKKSKAISKGPSASATSNDFRLSVLWRFYTSGCCCCRFWWCVLL